MIEHLGVEQWREDLTVLAAGLEREHANLFHSVSRVQFTRDWRALHARIPRLAGHEIVVEFARLVATVGDGHTALRPGNIADFRRFPLVLHQFSDGLFVRAIAPEHPEAAGARLLTIGGIPAAAASDAMRAVISHDNEQGIQAAAPALLSIPEVLHARGVVADPDRTTLEVESRDGTRLTVALSAGDGLPDGLVDARAAAAMPDPPWLRRPGVNWFELLAGSHTLYVGFNTVRDAADEPLAGFFDRIFAAALGGGAERLILDIRANGGGNMTLNRPLLHHLICDDALNRWGSLFAIIGRGTFSAAVNLAVDLERETQVIFVGEPTAAGPNHYGENAEIVLPHSRLAVSVSSLWWQNSDPRDERPWISPEIPAQLSSADYAANRDPALEAILAYELDPAHTLPFPDRVGRWWR